MKSEQACAVTQAAPTPRPDAPAPVPLFNAGAASAFGVPATPVFSGNTGPPAFLGGQEGSSAAPAAEATLRPVSRPTPGAPSVQHDMRDQYAARHVPQGPMRAVVNLTHVQGRAQAVQAMKMRYVSHIN